MTDTEKWTPVLSFNHLVMGGDQRLCEPDQLCCLIPRVFDKFDRDEDREGLATALVLRE